MNTAPVRPLARVSALAKRLGVSEQRAYELARAGLVGGVVRVGRQIRVDLDLLESWIAAGGQELPGGWRKQADDEDR